MLCPMVGQPLDLAVANLSPKSLTVQLGVLGIRLKLVSHVHALGIRIDGQPAIVEQTVDVPAKKQSAVFVVDAQLRVAVQMTGLEDARWGAPGERATITLTREEVLSELPLSAPNPHDLEPMTFGEVEVG